MKRLSNEAIEKGAWLLLTGSVVMFAASLCLSWQLPAIDNLTAEREQSTCTWPEPTIAQETDWLSFRSSAGPAEVVRGAIGKRFRLAGTFFRYDPSKVEIRNAVVDDLRAGKQYIVGEGDVLSECVVKRVLHDSIILKTDRGEEQLWISMAGGSSRPAGTRSDSVPSSSILSGINFIQESQFGGLIASNRWVFDRELVLGYYQELLDDPERLLNVFDSMAPVYDENQKIEGYVLDIVGEEDFFNDCGLRQGDIVRKVNSVPMSNRRRAEYFIKEFVSGRLNVFVMDVEKSGNPQQHVYQVKSRNSAKPITP